LYSGWCLSKNPDGGQSHFRIAARRLREIVVIEMAVPLLVPQALVINRLAGLQPALWIAGRSDETRALSAAPAGYRYYP
jgi:hypothetical protein